LYIVTKSANVVFEVNYFIHEIPICLFPLHSKNQLLI
jgi:hypothetical protein